MALPIFVTSPHAGEQIHPKAIWLKDKDSLVLLRDVDRFVTELYSDTCKELSLPMISSEWSRYVVDLNRFEDEVDAASVEGTPAPPRKHLRGLHWQVTTWGEKLIEAPISRELHQEILESCYRPFHKSVSEKFREFKEAGYSQVYHLDLHSMPSKGTQLHADPGKARAQVVISDFLGKSSRPEFLELVTESYREAGFEVAQNDPYIGGGITQRYGRPALGQHTLQIELNRSLYMDESTKEKLSRFADIQSQLKQALKRVLQELPRL